MRRLDVKLDAKDFNQALRSTILRISFDKQETVWAPVGDFFGSGNRLSPFQTFYTEVTADSVLSCFWVMPYQEECRIALQNIAKEEVETSLTVYKSPWEWKEQSMYFGAGWTEFARLHTRTNLEYVTTDDHFERNFVQLKGKGVYVGDGVTLFNSLADWWGEGDEKFMSMVRRFLLILEQEQKIIMDMPGACIINLVIRSLLNLMELAPLSVAMSLMCVIGD